MLCLWSHCLVNIRQNRSGEQNENVLGFFIVFFINTARLFETVTETYIQVSLSKHGWLVYSLWYLHLEYFANLKYVRVSTMSGWGISILFDILYLYIENTVSNHIRGYCIFWDPRNVKCLWTDWQTQILTQNVNIRVSSPEGITF